MHYSVISAWSSEVATVHLYVPAIYRFPHSFGIMRVQGGEATKGRRGQIQLTHIHRAIFRLPDRQVSRMGRCCLAA
jgi:hypothetical protein